MTFDPGRTPPPPPPLPPGWGPPAAPPRAPVRYAPKWIWIGVAAGIVSTIGASAVGWFIPAQLGSVLAAGIASLVGLLLPLGVGIVLAARKGSPTRRGFGLGLIIGWALAPVIFAGVCIVVISSLNAAEGS